MLVHPSSSALLDLISPFLICKDKLAKLEVAQHNASLVAVRHGQDNLLEQPAGLLLLQASAALHQGVHVPKVLVQKDVGPALPKYDVLDAGNVPVRRQNAVGSDLFLIHPHIKHL